MGGAQSRLDETNWDTADGGLTETKQCIVKTEPTSSNTTIAMIKHNIVNQRDYDIKDSEGNLLYTTKEVVGTVKCFDLLDKDAKKLCRVDTDASHKNWDVYSYEPVFEGQECDAEETKKAGGGEEEKLYKRAKITLGWLPWGKPSGTCALYDWDDHLKDKGGILGNAVLKVEEIKDVEAKYQTSVLPSVGKAPLVSYWDWEKTDTEHKMNIRLAKGVDLPLHVLLAVLTNMVRVERLADKAE